MLWRMNMMNPEIVTPCSRPCLLYISSYLLVLFRLQDIVQYGKPWGSHYPPSFCPVPSPFTFEFPPLIPLDQESSIQKDLILKNGVWKDISFHWFTPLLSYKKVQNPHWVFLSFGSQSIPSRHTYQKIPVKRIKMFIQREEKEDVKYKQEYESSEHDHEEERQMRRTVKRPIKLAKYEGYQ